MGKIVLEKGARGDAIEEIKQYFDRERSEDLSDFQADQLLDFILERIGPFIYNQAIGDAHKFLAEKADELYGLEIVRFR
jgi:uncharacterized protein (DUF2164 family)